jgi:hypothetical protein
MHLEFEGTGDDERPSESADLRRRARSRPRSRLRQVRRLPLQVG